MSTQSHAYGSPTANPLFTQLKISSLHLRQLMFRLTFAVFLVSCIRLPAQVSTTSIVGTVTDTSGAVIPNAKITATDLSTNQAYTSVSNSVGDFNIPQLIAAHYRIVVDAPTFTSWSIPDVELTVGQIFRVTPKLAVGNTTQTVEVTSVATATLQTDSGQVAAAITPEQWQNMPMVGRNFIALAQTVPSSSSYTGAQSKDFAGNTPDDRRRSTTVVVNGRSGSENNFMLDGLDDNERFVDTIIVKPSMEGIAEMNVVENSNSAELSRTSGASIVLVSKGGGNQYHGSLFDYIRNQITDADPPNLAAGQVVPPYKQDNYGGSMGGPIKKDKAYFFGDFEAYLSVQGVVQLSSVPTAAMRSGNFAGQNTIFDPGTTTPCASCSSGYSRTAYANNQITPSEINPIAKTIANLYPMPNDGTQLVNNYEYSASSVQHDYTVDSRVDYRFSANDGAFARYNFDNVHTAIPNVLPPVDGFDIVGGQLSTIGVGQPGNTHQVIDGGAISNTYTFSPAMVLTAAVGYNRYANHALPSGYGTDYADQLGMVGVDDDIFSSGFPDLGITNITSLGTGQYAPTINTNDVFTGSTELELQKGKHLMKFGGSLVQRYDQDYQSAEARIAYQFTNGFTSDPNNLGSTGVAFASFLLGYPSTTTRNRFLILPTYISTETAFYAQDDYRIRKALTLNIGLRWDYFSPLHEQQNRIENFDFNTLTLNAPGQGGYGPTVGVPKRMNNFGPRIGFAYQLDPKTVFRGGFGINYTPLMTGTAGAFRNPPNTDTFTITTTNLQTQNSISQPIAPLAPNSQTTLSGTIYAVSTSYKLPYVEQFNLTLQRILPFKLTFTNAFVGSLGRRQSGTNASMNMDGAYPSPLPVLQREVYYSNPNLTNLASLGVVRNYFTSSFYALETTIASSDWHGSTLNLNYTWSHVLDTQPYRYIAFDRVQQSKENGTADTRNRVNVTWILDLPYHHTDGWYSYPLRDWQFDAIAYFQSGLPFSVTEASDPTNSATGSTKTPNQIASFKVPNPTAAGWFNPAAFQTQPNYTWGSEGIDQLYGPGNWDMDIAIRRVFPIHERLTASLRLEMFDFTNTRYPGNPVAVLGSPGFGTILPTNFNNSRRMQGALIFNF